MIRKIIKIDKKNVTDAAFVPMPAMKEQSVLLTARQSCFAKITATVLATVCRPVLRAPSPLKSEKLLRITNRP